MVSNLVLKLINSSFKKTINAVDSKAVFFDIKPKNVIPLKKDVLELSRDELTEALLKYDLSKENIKILSLCEEPKVLLEALEDLKGSPVQVKAFIKEKIKKHKEFQKIFGRELNFAGINKKQLAIFPDDVSIDIMNLSAKHRATRLLESGKIKMLPDEMRLSPDEIRMKRIVDDKFKQIQSTNFDMMQYRGECLRPHIPHLRTIKQLKDGEVFEIPGYAWTTNSAEYAFGSYASRSEALDNVVVKYNVLCPKGTKILSARSRLGDEYVLPCDSKFRLVKKVVNEESGEIEIFCEHIPDFVK